MMELKIVYLQMENFPVHLVEVHKTRMCACTDAVLSFPYW